jgi:hypothetical protein
LKPQQGWFLKFVNSLLDYGPIILTVLFASLASLRASQSGTPTDQILQWLLLILVLLSTTQLIDRFRLLRGLERRLDILLKQDKSQVSARQLFNLRMPDLEDRLRKAKTIDHNGITLVNTSNNRLGAFSTCLAAGGMVRLILPKPKYG